MDYHLEDQSLSHLSKGRLELVDRSHRRSLDNGDLSGLALAVTNPDFQALMTTNNIHDLTIATGSLGGTRQSP